jgi:L-gulono-1,4-lactone dehydrogenase
MRCRRRRVWRNHTGNVTCSPLLLCRPESLQDLVEVVQRAEADGTTVRAIGSGHSWSDAAVTGGYMLEPDGLTRALELEHDLLRDVAPAGKSWVRVESGMRVRELNAHLDEQGLALQQMGGYDGQTIAGVVSTSTHGSGLGLGPLCDFVRSLDVVGGGGRVYRIEASDGPTDPAAYQRRYPDHTLVQDDHWLRAAAVGVGCLGAIYSLLLEVQDEYQLEEVRTERPWSQVAEDLRKGDVFRAHRHYEVYVNPHGRGGDHTCMVTTRHPTSEPAKKRPERRRNSIPEFLASLPVLPPVIDFIVGMRPSLSPWLLDRGLKALADRRYVSASYKVFNIGTANLLPAYSAELAVPVDERGSHVEAMERVFEVAEQHRQLGGIFHTAPIALRFVAPSPGYLSMMEGRPTMMMELIQLKRTEGGMELLAAYEEALEPFGARPHWGQIQSLFGGKAQLATLYPHLEDWLEVRAELDPAGTFVGTLSRRLQL